MKQTDAQIEHAVRTAYLKKVMLVRHALEQAGLCGPDEDEENNGREAALRVIQCLAQQRVAVHVLPPPEPPYMPPPTLGERIAGGASTLGNRITKAAAAHRPKWTSRRALRAKRSQT